MIGLIYILEDMLDLILDIVKFIEIVLDVIGI